MNKQKKGLIPELRFPDFKDDSPWTNRPLASVLNEHGLKSSGKEVVFSVSVHKGLINQVEHLGRSFSASNTDNYNRVIPGDIVYTKSPTGDFPLGIIKQSKVDYPVIVSPLYGVFSPETKGLGALLDAYFETPANTKLYLDPLVQKGAKNTINVTNKKFLSGSLPLPISKAEQEKLGFFIDSIDELITLHTQKLNALKDHKKGLMQQLFPAEGETAPKLRFSEFFGKAGWSEKRFENIFKIISGKGFKASEYSNDGIRLLQIENVGYGVTNWTNDTVHLPDTYLAEYPDLLLREGDIVVALNRPVTNDQLKIARIGELDSPSILYQRVGKLKIIGKSVLSDFAFHICRQFIKDFVVKKSIGSDQPFISLRELYAQIILIPSLDEQKKIAGILTYLDESISCQSTKIETLTLHKKGLIQRLFPVMDDVVL